MKNRRIEQILVDNGYTVQVWYVWDGYRRREEYCIIHEPSNKQITKKYNTKKAMLEEFMDMAFATHGLFRMAKDGDLKK